MSPLLRKMLDRCALARATLRQPIALTPFGAVAGTPLALVADNYLSIITGSAVFPGTGSALVLRPGLAVTSAHVVEGMQSVTARSRRGPVEAQVIRRSRCRDLAVLAVPPDLGRELPIGRARAGRPVWAMGTTTGSLAPVAAGLIENERATAWLDEAPDGPYHDGLMYAAPAGPGYSGGPVVDESGALVGITEGIYTRVFGEPPVAWPRLPRMFAYHADDILADADAAPLRQI